ncbi:MAG: tRNA (guanosine(37)-N1)-methyltransferase TrmD [Rickettsiales bacterium]|nr:tRNA (guanosine(37)-N1)-methyltransferase TrmD [Rickettsiales bacterium]
MKIDVFTIFPDIIKDFCSKSLLGKALLNGRWKLNAVNIRDYSKDKHGRVDDIPYGGGQGMVLKADVIGDCIDGNCSENTKIIYMSPRGKVLNQSKIKELLKYDDIAIICGRYEGMDERVIERYNIEEISIGDYVLMGGELPAMVLIESMVRCLEGVIGNDESQKEDSFGGGYVDSKFNHLLEYPLYTRPEVWRDMTVPDVLLSGHHKNIEKWKIEKAIEITKNRRPDLYEKYINNDEHDK